MEDERKKDETVLLMKILLNPGRSRKRERRS
jgi:hypothetical protein